MNATDKNYSLYDINANLGMMVMGLDNKTQDTLATLVGDAIADGRNLAVAWHIGLTHAAMRGIIDDNQIAAVRMAFDGLHVRTARTYEE